MATVKPFGFASGSPAGVEVAFGSANRSASVNTWGVPTVVGAFSLRAGSTAVFEDGTADLIQITQAPARGHLVARPDGRMSFNHNDDLTTGVLPFQYQKTTGGNTETIDGTITVETHYYTEGYDKGEYFLPEIDYATNELVVQPAPGAKPIHYTPAGLTSADIAALEPSYTDTGVNDAAEFCLKNAATGEGGAFYGETEALALSPEIAYRMARRISIAPDSYPDYGGVIWMLAERGQVYPEVNFDVASANGVTDIGADGYSYLHPNYYGAYGTGDNPYVQGKAIGLANASRSIIQNQDSGGSTRILNAVGCLLANVKMDSQHIVSGSEYPPYIDSNDDNMCFKTGFYRVKSFDVRRLEPQDANNPRTSWENNPDRISGGYMGDTVHGLSRECFIDTGGWFPGYRADKFGGPDDQSTIWLPQPPSTFNQSLYIQTSTRAITIIDFISTRGALSALQCRGAATILGMFSAGNNEGISLGRGWYTDATKNTGPFTGHYNFMDDTVHTYAGAKDTWAGDMARTGAGHSYAGYDLTFLHSAVMNAEWPFERFANDQEFGPKSREAFLKGYNPFFVAGSHPNPTIARNETVISNWNRETYPDQNVTGIAEATRDALTVETFTDNLLSQSGSTLDDLCVHLRSLQNPHAQFQPILDHFLVPLGKGRSTRTVAQTVAFRPNADGYTPGVRADVRWDWNTFDLPGSVANDSVDLAGHKVAWQITPKNAINDLTFGAGGFLEMFGGVLRPLGSVNVDAGGNTLSIQDGAKFDLPGYSGSGLLTVEMQEGRLMNTGTVTGNIDVTARYRSEIIFGYDNASWTVPSGRSITIYGHVDCGFDGALGGTASLTLQSGSSLTFEPTIKTGIDQKPTVVDVQLGQSGDEELTKSPSIDAVPGSTITGQTTGATARVAFAARSFLHVLDDLTGEFAANEIFDGEGEIFYTISQGAVTSLGRIVSVEAALGSIKKFRSGINGFSDPNVTANVTIDAGALLSINVASVPDGSYTLIEADTLSGAYMAPNVTIQGGASKDVTLAHSGTSLTLTVSTGTGQVIVI